MLTGTECRKDLLDLDQRLRSRYGLGTRADGSIETNRQCVAALLPWVLLRQFQQPTTVRRQPPFIEVGHAEQQSLLPGRLHVPRRHRTGREPER